MTRSGFAIFRPYRGPLRANRKTGWVARLLTLIAIRRERLRLSEMTPEQLNDIGVTPEQARREASRAAWDAPDRWML